MCVEIVSGTMFCTFVAVGFRRGRIRRLVVLWESDFFPDRLRKLQGDTGDTHSASYTQGTLQKLLEFKRSIRKELPFL